MVNLTWIWPFFCPGSTDWIEGRRAVMSLFDASMGKRPVTVYTAEQITKRAIVAGFAAYKAIIRSGGSTAVAERAYSRAYSRTIPPCWAALLPPPVPPRGEFTPTVG